MTGRIGAACLTYTELPINPRAQAASGDAGGSSSSSSGGPGIRYASPSQRPRSTSAQREEQNGRFASDGARPQIGQRGGALAMHSLNTPAVTRQRRIGSRIQPLANDPRKIRERHLIGLQRGDHRGRGA